MLCKLTALLVQGSLRVDANVSIHRAGTPYGTRCEIKNLNSVRFMQQALGISTSASSKRPPRLTTSSPTRLCADYERRRHAIHYLTNPDVPLRQETRGFNESTGETHTLRTKEDAEDYRYMPDPNLPPVAVAAVSWGRPWASVGTDLDNILLPALPREFAKDASGTSRCG